MIRMTAVPILFVALAQKPTIAGKWMACLTAEGRTGCTTWELAVKGDSLWGTDTGPDGQSDLIVGHIQGDRVSFKTGNGCTERVLQRCTVLVSGTYHGDGWKADVNDTDNQRHHVFTVTRVTGKP